MQAVDAFTYLVKSDDKTLLDIARETRYCIDDLLKLNPELKSECPPSFPILNKGAMVKLPVSLRLEGASHGAIFCIQKKEEELQRLEHEMLARAECLKPLAFPRRKVESKTEKLVNIASREADRQLDGVRESLMEIETHNEANRKLAIRNLHHLVDISVLQNELVDVENEFSSNCLSLNSFKDDLQYNLFSRSLDINQAQQNGVPIRRPSYDSDPDNVDVCIDHTHRWEFVICKPNSLEEMETWAVLSCQKLTTLISAIRCPFEAKLNSLHSSFLFVGGSFYIDGEEDISRTIRTFNPGSELDVEGNASFASCPVKVAKQVTFGELALRLGQLCVFRHFGTCDHYFYLRGVKSLFSPQMTKDHHLYPLCIEKRREVVIRCVLCKKFPSSVALYEKHESSALPLYLCDICYELFYEGTEKAEKLLKVCPPSLGEYFTS